MLFLAIGFGLLYNRTCKVSVLSPIWISFSFSILFLLPYFSLRVELTLPIVLVFLYALFLMYWQISWEGYIKEFGVDKVNLLQRMGCRLNDGYFVPSLRARTFGWAFRVPTLIVGTLIWFVLGGELYSLLGYALLSLGVVFSTHQLIKRRKYENKR